jgi:hypothetical protein
MSVGSKFKQELSDFLKDESGTRPDTMSKIASYYWINSRKIQRHFKNNVSGFQQWNQKSHTED